MDNVFLSYHFPLIFTVGTAGPAGPDDCTAIPTCESMGFKKTLAACNSLETLKCPFDYNKVFCVPDSAFEDGCIIGSILYSDKSCSTDYNSAKTAVGIVVDLSRRWAISLSQVQTQWVLGPTDYNLVKIPGLISTVDEKVAETQFDGKLYTQTILAYNPNYQAAKYCNDMSASGTGFGAGNWYLPALGELNLIYVNKAAVNTALAKVASMTQLSSYSTYWSSSENSTFLAWQQGFGIGNVGTGSKDSDYPVRCMVQY